MNSDIRQHIEDLYIRYMQEQEETGHCSESFSFDIDAERKNHERIAGEIKQLLPNNHMTRVLDVGSGFGDFVFGLSSYADDVWGVELDSNAVEISKLKKKLYTISNVHFIKGVAEHLPIETGTVDLVVSKTVLEHVENVSASLSEIDRVLKPGGFFYLEVPNYMWIKEGHYQMLMFPLMPKPLFRIWARILGKNPQFINKINYITPHWIKKELGSTSLILERNLSEEMLQRILLQKDAQRIPPAYQGLRSFFRLLWNMRLERFAYRIVTTLGFYPVIMMLIRKQATSSYDKQ